VSPPPIIDLEERAFRAWPAAEVGVVGGWRLRHTGGVTRRANSVWPNEVAGSLSLERRLQEVSAFYRARGLPALYQISGAAGPPGLDDELARRGYTLEAPVAVQVADAVDARPGLVPGIEVRIDETVTPAWFDISAHQGRFAAAADIYRGLLERLRGRSLFALALDDGRPAAVGLGVIDGEWLGVCSMLTLGAHRRRGLGGAILGALATAAASRGCAQLYLQVELDNEPARALYRRAGFREAYRTHYRRAPG
jgi:GNAT superfamily N-acetyltransferase